MLIDIDAQEDNLRNNTQDFATALREALYRIPPQLWRRVELHIALLDGPPELGCGALSGTVLKMED